MAQSRFLRRNQLLRQVAPLLGKYRKLVEDKPVRANEIKAGQNDGNQRRCEKNVRLPRDTIVNFRDLDRGALFALIILHEQTRNRSRKRRKLRLQGKAKLLACLVFVA